MDQVLKDSSESESCVVPQEKVVMHKTLNPLINQLAGQKTQRKREKNNGNRVGEPKVNKKHGDREDRNLKIKSQESEPKESRPITDYKKLKRAQKKKKQERFQKILVNPKSTKEKQKGNKNQNQAQKNEEKIQPKKIFVPKKNYIQKLAELKQKSKVWNWVMMLSLVIALNFYGYYLVMGNVMAVPLTKYVYGLDVKEQKEVNGQFGACFAAGYLFSNLNMGVFTKYIGRVRTVLLMEVLKIILILCLTIKDLRVFLVLRAFTGLIAGLQSAIVPLTGNEMMPTKIALVGGGMFFSSITLFMTIASFMNIIFGGEEGLAKHSRLVFTWPLIFCFITIFAVVSTVGLSETPDYYIENISDLKELKKKIFKTMKKIYTKESALEFIKIKLEEFAKKQRRAIKTKNKLFMNWGTMFSNSFRKQLFAGCVICILKELSGNMFMVYFSTQVFDEVSGNGAQITVILSLSMFVGAVISVFVIEMGRKKVMLVSTFIHGLALAILVVGIHLKDPMINCIGTALYISSFGCGLCAVLGIYIIEILPPFGVGVTFAIQWMIVAAIGWGYSFLMENLGSEVIMAIHLFFCCLLFLSIYFLAYETKGYSKEEIQLIFMTGKNNPDGSQVSVKASELGMNEEDLKEIRLGKGFDLREMRKQWRTQSDGSPPGINRPSQPRLQSTFSGRGVDEERYKLGFSSLESDRDLLQKPAREIAASVH